MSRVVAQDVVDQLVIDTLTETNVFVGTIPSGEWVGNAVLLEQTGRYQNSGSSQFYTIRLYIGSSGGTGGTLATEFRPVSTGSSALGHAAWQRWTLMALDADSLRVIHRWGVGGLGSDGGLFVLPTAPGGFITNRMEGLSLSGAVEIWITVQLSSVTGTTHQFSSRGVWAALLTPASSAVDATVTPGVIARSFAIPAAGAQASSSVTPAVISRSLAVPQVGPSASSSVTPAVVAQPFTIPQATPQTAGNATVTPASIDRAVAIPQAGVAASSSVTPAVVARSISVPQASPQAASSVTPGAMARSFVIPQATPDTGGTSATVNPALMSRAFAVPQVSLSAAASVTPAVVSRAFLIPQAVPSMGTTASPAVLTGAFVVPQVVVTATGGASVTPDPITMLLTIPQVLGQGTLPLIISHEGSVSGGAPSGAVVTVSRKGPG